MTTRTAVTLPILALALAGAVLAIYNAAHQPLCARESDRITACIQDACAQNPAHSYCGSQINQCNGGRPEITQTLSCSDILETMEWVQGIEQARNRLQQAGQELRRAAGK